MPGCRETSSGFRNLAAAKETLAHFGINALSDETGWRFFPDDDVSTNVRFAPGVPLTHHQLYALGEVFHELDRDLPAIEHFVEAHATNNPVRRIIDARATPAW